jgi:hypothetical protein
VVYAREDRRDDDLGGVPQLGDHIHQSVAFNACGQFLPDLPEFESPVGIHTHGDGVIHIHPFSQLGVGANATFERYLEDARDDGGLEVEISDDKLEYLGETYEEGDADACEGVDDPQLRVAYWDDVQDAESEPEITTGGFGDRRLTTDGAGLTIFFGDADADIPKPPTAENLAVLGAADGGQVPDEEGNTTTTAAGASTTSSAPATGEPSDTSTTVAADPSSTTVAP